MKYLRHNSEHSLYLSQVTHIEVQDVKSHLDSTESVGPSSIPINLLTILKRHISHPLAELVNQSLSKGIFPQRFLHIPIQSVKSYSYYVLTTFEYTC